MTPSLGRIVLYHGPHGYNGERGGSAIESPAIVTAVWSDYCVNLSIIPDGGSVEVRTSVVLDESFEQATGWRWPPRAEAPSVPV